MPKDTRKKSFSRLSNVKTRKRNTNKLERFKPTHQSKANKTKNFWAELSKHRMDIFIRVSFLFVVLICATVFFYLRYQFKVYETYEVIQTQEVAITSGTRAQRFGNSLLVYGSDGAKCINSKGDVVWNVTYEMQNPRVDISGNVAGIADYNGSKIYMMDETQVLGEISTGMPIRSFRVSPKGLAIAVLDDTATTPIYIYDKTGEQKAFFSTTMRNSGYPVATCISDSGHLVGISYLYVDNGNFKTNVAFYNFGEVGKNETDNLVSGYTYANAIVPQMEFVSPSKAVAIADNRLMFYSGNEKPISDGEVMLQENVISSFYGNGYVGLVHNNVDGEARYRVDIYDESGRKKDSVVFDSEYDEMFFDDGRIIIYNAERCLIHKIGGVEKFNGEFNTPILAMAPTNVADRFILISADGIRTVELK